MQTGIILAMFCTQLETLLGGFCEPKHSGDTSILAPGYQSRLGA